VVLAAGDPAAAGGRSDRLLRIGPMPAAVAGTPLVKLTRVGWKRV